MAILEGKSGPSILVRMPIKIWQFRLMWELHACASDYNTALFQRKVKPTRNQDQSRTLNIIFPFCSAQYALRYYCDMHLKCTFACAHYINRCSRIKATCIIVLSDIRVSDWSYKLIAPLTWWPTLLFYDFVRMPPAAHFHLGPLTEMIDTICHSEEEDNMEKSGPISGWTDNTSEI